MVKGKMLEIPHVYEDDDARLAMWTEMWPNAEFALVHKYNKNGTENPMEIFKYRGLGYDILSEDQKIVQHPGHVLMGVHKEWRAERRKKELDRFNRNRLGRSVESETVGGVDGGVVNETVTEKSGTFEDLMNS